MVKLNFKLSIYGCVAVAVFFLIFIQIIELTRIMIRHDNDVDKYHDVYDEFNNKNNKNNKNKNSILKSQQQQQQQQQQITTHTTKNTRQEEENDNNLDADDIQIQSIINHLTDKKSIIPYYMYDDPQIEQSEMVHNAIKTNNSIFGSYVIAENYILNHLKSHHWRRRTITTPPPTTTTTTTNNNNNNNNNDDVMLYIIPFSTSATILNDSEEAKQNVTNAFQSLYNTKTFQSTYGHKHILFSLAIPTFSTWRKFPNNKVFNKGLKHEYSKLINITLANDLDFEAIFEYKKTLKSKYQYLVQPIHPITRYSFSMNLQEYNTLPLIKATNEKFYNSSIHIFYHIRERKFANKATKLRRSPLKVTIPPVNTTTYNNNNNKKMYNNNNGNNKSNIISSYSSSSSSSSSSSIVSSIGYDIPKDEWITKYTNTQFCLVVRGDTPHSRSFLRAIKVGCIPVLIMEVPYFSPIFKHIIPLEKYSIIINDEDKFVQNVTKELLKLRNIPKDVITSKIKWLALAQRLFFIDHPKSLFIESFLIEANISSTIDLHYLK